LHAQIPGAFSLPLFTDEQRKIIGTAYKQQSREVAVNHGLDYFSERMKIIPGEAINISGLWQQQAENFTVSSASGRTGFLVHCWRGGMRSEAVAWLLGLYGYPVYVLKGGYKSFRSWTLEQFRKTYKLKILGGFTGSGKTELLKEMRGKGRWVIDLEGLANHKGSAFGNLGEKPQPSQEMFENLLALELLKAERTEKMEETTGNVYPQINKQEIWLEDESRNIGNLHIPDLFWQQMRNSKLYFLEIPFDSRLDFIVSTYNAFNINDLIACVSKIQKKLGGLETKNAISFLSENKVKECFSILLKHYDKLYSKALLKRENIESLFNKINCESVHINNADRLC